MRIKVKIAMMAVLLTHNGWLTAQTLSNRGKEFWVGYGHHQFMEPANNNSQEMILYFSAEEKAHVTVTINNTAYSEEYDVPANAVITSKLIPKGAFSQPASPYDPRLYTRPIGYPGGTSSEGIFSKHGIHVQSDVPVVVYAHIYGDLNSGAAMLMPVDTWGYSYVSVNTKQLYNGGNYDCFSWLYVVASHNDTRIRLVPSVNSRGGRLANIPFTVDLQKGEIYQFAGAFIDAQASQDVTGTTVTSVGNDAGECYPIAVFSGSSRTQIACTGNTGSGDNLIQQIFPYQSWGRHYLTSPTSVDNALKTHNINIYRIIVKDPATVVMKNGQRLFGLNGFYYEYQSDVADYIEADKPIMVAQYMPSQNACGYVGNGDPEMIYISSIEQSIKHVGFYRATKQAINVNYLTLIIPTAGVASLKIDGALNNFNDVYAHPNYPGYSVVVKRWNAAAAQCITESDSAFTAITYGMGGAESYGYNAGTLINNLNGVASINNKYNPVTQANNYTCANTPVELSVLMRYKPVKLEWRLSELAGIISPAVNVVVTSPVDGTGVLIPAGTQLINGVVYYKYKLPGYYTFTTPGNHIVPLHATSPVVETCNQTEQVQYAVLVKPGYSTQFNIVYQNCTTSERIQFTGDYLFNTKDSIKNWEWTFSNNTTASGMSVAQVFTTGTYTVRLFAVDSVGCVADTSKIFTLTDKPAKPAFSVISTNNCEASAIQFAETNAEAGVKNWYWDFGNKDTVTVSSGDPQSKTFSTYGTKTIKHVVKFSDVCISDTASVDVVIYAKPVLNIGYPTSCIDKDGLVQFTSKSTSPDGQALTGYAWNFGDANASAVNTNTSTLANPTHYYTVFGNYNIGYQVTTVQGCKKDSVFKVSFISKPALSYGLLNDVCEDISTLSVAQATVTNGVQGTGIYRGPGTDAAGNFKPAIAGAGIHTVWYVFTSSNGCIDSVMQTITVHPKPIADFDVTKDICTDQSTVITDHTIIAGTNSVSSWHWNFGDGTSVVYTNANVFNRSYATYGTYQVQLVAISAKGCISDTATKAVMVHSLPVADFRLAGNVCMPDGQAVFTDLSSSPDGSALTYQWSLGDGNTSTQKDAVHVYAAGGSYNVQLKATSAAGCSAVSNIQPFSHFSDRPVAAFSVAPAIICQGAQTVFTDNSTSTNGTIQQWAWDFGDGQVSTRQNPTKAFSNPGKFSVTLSVTNSQGCDSKPFASPVTVYAQPQIEAGPSLSVAQGTVVQFTATANQAGLSINWTPSALLSNPNTLTPVYVATQDQTFVLTATGGGGNCTATDALTIKILRLIKVPNVFSPNGDGINDRWMIPNLADYAGATVEVYNRYGQPVFRSDGYGTPWDGRIQGNPVPVGTYYYIIKLKNGFAPLNGSVTIIR